MDVDTRIGFGVHYAKSVSEVPSSYLRWVIENIEDKPDLIEVMEQEIEYRDRFDKHFEE